MDSANITDSMTPQAEELTPKLLKGKRLKMDRASQKRGPAKVRRGNQLRYILGDVEPLHKTIIVPASNKARYPAPVQLCLFEQKTGGNVKMGSFYEAMTMGIFGGKMLDIHYFDKESQEEENQFAIHPDVISDRRKKAWESKAIRVGQGLNIIDSQVKKYKMFQILKPDYRFYWVFWRHEFKGIIKHKGDVLEINKILSRVTLCGIVVPFNFITKYSEMGDTFYDDGRKRTKRWENDNWHHCTSLASPEINRLLYEPEAIGEEFGMDLDIQRVRTPEGFKVEDQDIDPLCIVIINDRNYSKWARELSDAPPF